MVEHGTAAASKIPGISDVRQNRYSSKSHGKDNSLFVAFAPRDSNPKIAIAVVVENAGQGRQIGPRLLQAIWLKNI